MAGHREPQHTEPAASQPRPGAAPPTFGTGLGSGIGAPATVIGALAMRPAEDRAEILRDLQQRAGNRSVSQMLLRDEGDAQAPGSWTP